jgi:hypothetical protein
MSSSKLHYLGDKEASRKINQKEFYCNLDVFF